VMGEAAHPDDAVLSVSRMGRAEFFIEVDDLMRNPSSAFVVA
jgi:hypothetical protein